MKSTNHIQTQNSRASLRGLSQSVRRQICRLFAVLAALLTAASAGAVDITNTFTTVGSTTWTCPVGVTSISVAVQGGGGGGGGSTTGNNRIGAGGGGGACAFSPALTVVPGTVYTVTVGAGGAAGTTSGAGGPGGASSFSDGVITTLTANGGSGGGANSTGVGGTGGTADGGTSNFSGGDGVNGASGTPPISAGAGGGGAGTDADGSPGSGATGGAGGAGSPAGGNGGNSPTAQNNGSAGAAPGGGGSGGCKGASASKGGGAGGKGKVTIVYTIPDPTIFVKADNTDNLTVGSSWTNGVAPDAVAIATWDNTVTSVNTVSLGADATWAGINIINPGGNVTINAGNTLTNGSSGIDMSSATVDLTLNCGLVLGAANTWSVTSGRTLTMGGAVTGDFGITKQGEGTVTLSGLSATAANNYTGTTIIDQGTLAITATSPAFNGGLTFGAAAGNANVGVLDLSAASATYTGAFLAQNTSASANSITIGSGQTLQLNGAVTVGYNSAVASTTKLAGTGLGTLAIGTSGTPVNANVQIGNGQGNNIGNAGTLDLSLLSTFNAYLGTGTFRVGSTVNSGGGTGGAGGSMVILATNSTIQATTILLASQDSAAQTLSLGSGLNVLNVSSITLANTGRSSSDLNFNGASGTLTVRGITGDSTRADLSLGVNPSFSSGSSVTGTFDTTGHSSDLLFGTMTLGLRGVSNTGGGTGTINFDTGTLDANDLKAGFVTAGTADATGNVNLSGGTATFNTITAAIKLGDNAANAATATGNLNISGTANVTVAANSGNSIILGNAAVAGGTANGTVNLTGGSLIVAGDIIRGTATGTSTATLAVGGGTLNMGGHNLTSLTSINYTDGLISNLGVVNTGINLLGTGSRDFDQDAAYSGTIQDAIVDSGLGVGLTKTGTGTLALDAANTYTGDTTVSAGTLLVNGSLAADSAVTVNGGALGGTGVINGLVTVNTGGTLSPGSSLGVLTINGNLVLNAGSTNLFEVDTTVPTNDVVVLGAAVTYGGVLNIVTNGTFTAGQTFTLFSGAGATTPGNFASIQGSPGAGLGFTFTNGVLSVVSTGPAYPPATLLTNSLSGSTLTLSWPINQGWRLEVQTNSLGAGLATNWFTWPDSASTNAVSIPINPANPTVFYRLVYP